MTRARLAFIVGMVLILLSAGAYGAADAKGSNAPTEEVEIFFDDMENGVNGWTVEAVSSGAVYCEPEWFQELLPDIDDLLTTAWTNVPYQQAIEGNCYNELTTPAILVPANATALRIEWEHRHIIEPDTGNGGDSGAVQVSDNGLVWEPVSPLYEGISGATGLEFVPMSVDVADNLFTPGADVQVRFHFTSDALLTTVGGWTVDDVRVVAITSAPTAVTLNSFGNAAVRNPVLPLALAGLAVAGLLAVISRRRS